MSASPSSNTPPVDLVNRIVSKPKRAGRQGWLADYLTRLVGRAGRDDQAGSHRSVADLTDAPAIAPELDVGYHAIYLTYSLYN